MAFDKSMIQNIDQSTVEGVDVQYPLIQWGYGNVKLGTKVIGVEGGGGFFITFDNMPAAIKDDLIIAMTTTGWQNDSITLNDGTSVDGLYSPKLVFSLVSMRKRWRASDGNGRTGYFPFTWENHERAVADYGRATSQIHILAYVRGLEQFSPFVITMSGSAAMAFEGTKKMPGVLTAYSRTVIASANASTRGFRWPYRAFWLTIAAATDGKNRPLFTEVGSGANTSNVVLPVAVGLPADPKSVDLDQFALDKTDFLRVQDIFSESQEWKAAWDKQPDKQTVQTTNEEVDFSRDAVASLAHESGL